MEQDLTCPYNNSKDDAVTIIDTIKSAMAKNEPNMSSTITSCENATAGQHFTG